MTHRIDEAEIVRLAWRLAKAASRKGVGRRPPEELLGAAYFVVRRRAEKWRPGKLSLDRYILLYAGRVAWEARIEDSIAEPSIHNQREINAGRKARPGYTPLDALCRGQGDGQGRPWSEVVGSPDPAIGRVEAVDELEHLVGTNERIRRHVQGLVWGDTGADMARREGISTSAVTARWREWAGRVRKSFAQESPSQGASPVETTKTVGQVRKKRRR